VNSAVSNAVLKMIGQSNRPVRLADIIDFVENELGGKGSKFCSLITVTQPKVKKMGNPNPVVNKVSNSTYTLNFDYATRVENARERAGLDREYDKGTSWHEQVRDAQGRLMPLCRHKEKGSLYFYAALKDSGESQYFNEAGQPLDFETQVKPYMPASSGSSRQGLDMEDQIHPRAISLDNVKAIKYGGECVVLTND